MHRRIGPCCILLAICCGEWAVAAPVAHYAADRIIIKFKSEIVRNHPNPDSVAEDALQRTLGLESDTGIQETGYGRYLRAERGGPAAGLDIRRPLRLSVPRGESAASLVKRMQSVPGLDYAEPDYIGTGFETLPNDPNFSSQWYHRNTASTAAVPADIRSALAWDITRGLATVIVAVVDTGLSTNLSEFAGRIEPGYDFVNYDDDPSDDHNHGTRVASILAARGSNSTLVAGVNWFCRIMPLKGLNASNQGYYSDWADAIEYAVDHGARVINLSAGGYPTDFTLSNAIMYAVSSGVVFVAATGNDNTGVGYPASMQVVIAVGATGSNDRRMSWSNYGTALDLVAPGDNMTCVNRDGTLRTGSFGTSYASPLVAGVASLLVGIRPELNPRQVCALLAASADDRVGDASDTAGFDNYYGWGRLNAFNALMLALCSPAGLRGTDGNPMLSWSSPPNASNRTPYQLQCAANLQSAWSNSSETQLTYTALTTAWTSSNAAPDSVYYRILIRPQ